MMRRLSLVLAAVLLVSALFVLPLPALAQGWSYTFDFSFSNGGWVADPNGVYQNGRWESIDGGAPHFDQLLIITRAIDSSTITSVRVVYVAGDAGLTSTRVIQYGAASQNLSQAAGAGDVTLTSTQAGVTELLVSIDTDDTPSNINYITLIVVTGTGTNPFVPGGPTETPTPMPVLSGWTRPLKTSDTAIGDLASYGAVNTAYTQLNDATPFSGNQRLSIGYSARPGLAVHNIFAGTVSGVDPAAAGSCTSSLFTPQGYCEFAGSEPNNAVGAPTRYGVTSGVYIITVDLASGLQIKYAVSDPLVNVGDDVAAGCILGKTIGVREALSISDSARDVEYGVVLFQGINGTASFDIRPALSDEPSGTACAAIATGDRACRLVGDSDFRGTSNSWTFLAGPGGVAGIAPEGRGLLLRGTVEQQLNLDPGVNYTITIIYRKLVQNPQPFEVQLGTESPVSIQDATEAVDVPITYTTAPDTYTPNSTAGGGHFYWFALRAAGSLSDFQIRVDYACVSEAGEGDVQAPGGCLLYNHEFDSSVSDAWTLDPGTTLAQISGGMLFLGPDDASAAQSLRLSPKDSGPQTYTITVRTRRQGVPVVGESLDIIWAWGGFNGTFTSSNNTFTDFTDDFTVTVEATNDVTLTVDDANSATSGVAQIDRVCITTSDGVVPPGYQGPPVIASACRICAYYPVGDVDLDISEYVAWLACFLSQLWECAFKSVLAGIWTVLTNILTFLGFFRLWLGYVFESGAVWTNGNINVVANWFNGQFLNLGQRIENALVGVRFGTVITEGGGAGFWDVLLELIRQLGQLGTSIVNGISAAIAPIAELLGRIVDGLFGLIGAILSLIAAIISMIVNLVLGFMINAIGLVVGVFQSVVNGVNTTATPILPEWVPNCSDPQSGLFFACIGLYVLEQSLTASDAFALFLPIIIGLVCLHLLLWAAEQYLSVFQGDSD